MVSGVLHRKSLSIIGLLIVTAFAMVVAASGRASAENATAADSSSSAFVICSNQTYALCAVASCFVLDGLAYCSCEVLGRQYQRG